MSDIDNGTVRRLPEWLCARDPSPLSEPESVLAKCPWRRDSPSNQPRKLSTWWLMQSPNRRSKSSTRPRNRFSLFTGRTSISWSRTWKWSSAFCFLSGSGWTSARLFTDIPECLFTPRTNRFGGHVERDFGPRCCRPRLPRIACSRTYPSTRQPAAVRVSKRPIS